MQIEMFQLSLSFWFVLPLFSLPSTCSKIVPFLEDLVVITALSHSGSFGKHFFCFRKKKLFTSLGWSVSIGKNCALCLAYGLGWYPRPQAQFFLIQTSHLVNNIYIFYFSKKVEEKFNSLTVVSISYDLKRVSLKMFLILRLFMVWFWTFLHVLRIWFLWSNNYLVYNLSETVSDKQISHRTEMINDET